MKFVRDGFHWNSPASTLIELPNKWKSMENRPVMNWWIRRHYLFRYNDIWLTTLNLMMTDTFFWIWPIKVGQWSFLPSFRMARFAVSNGWYYDFVTGFSLIFPEIIFFYADAISSSSSLFLSSFHFYLHFSFANGNNYRSSELVNGDA